MEPKETYLIAIARYRNMPPEYAIVIKAMTVKVIALAKPMVSCFPVKLSYKQKEELRLWTCGGRFSLAERRMLTRPTPIALMIIANSTQAWRRDISMSACERACHATTARLEEFSYQ
jgi:hypothetical protein